MLSPLLHHFSQLDERAAANYIYDLIKDCAIDDNPYKDADNIVKLFEHFKQKFGDRALISACMATKRDNQKVKNDSILFYAILLIQKNAVGPYQTFIRLLGDVTHEETNQECIRLRDNNTTLREDYLQILRDFTSFLYTRVGESCYHLGQNRPALWHVIKAASNNMESASWVLLQTLEKIQRKIPAELLGDTLFDDEQSIPDLLIQLKTDDSTQSKSFPFDHFFKLLGIHHDPALTELRGTAFSHNLFFQFRTTGQMDPATITRKLTLAAGYKHEEFNKLFGVVKNRLTPENLIALTELDKYDSWIESTLSSLADAVVKSSPKYPFTDLFLKQETFIEFFNHLCLHLAPEAILTALTQRVGPQSLGSYYETSPLQRLAHACEYGHYQALQSVIDYFKQHPQMKMRHQLLKAFTTPGDYNTSPLWNLAYAAFNCPESKRMLIDLISYFDVPIPDDALNQVSTRPCVTHRRLVNIFADLHVNFNDLIAGSFSNLRLS